MKAGANNWDPVPTAAQSVVSLPACTKAPYCRLKLENNIQKQKQNLFLICMVEIFHKYKRQNKAQHKKPMSHHIAPGTWKSGEPTRKRGIWGSERQGRDWLWTHGGYRNATNCSNATGKLVGTLRVEAALQPPSGGSHQARRQPLPHTVTHAILHIVL